MELEDFNHKIVKLSGVCDAVFHAGFSDELVDGFIVLINGVNYAAYVDPDDGYRSYGSIGTTDKPCTNTFPPQDVLLKIENNEGLDDDGYWIKQNMLYLLNPDTKELIFEAGTMWYGDTYYPVGRCYFNPVALPINQIKKAL